MKNEIIKKKIIKLISIYHYGVVYFYGVVSIFMVYM